MALRVNVSFVFTDDEIEGLDIEQHAELVEKMIYSSEYTTEILKVDTELVNMECIENEDTDYSFSKE